MKGRLAAAAALLAVTSAVIAAAPAGIRVEHPWIRWLPANLPVAGYATIVNSSDAPERLTGASSPDYADVTLMQSHLAEEDSRMDPVTHVDVPAHGTATLAPGGYHVMLMHAKRAIKPGDTVTLTLRFAGGAAVQVDFPVLPANAVGPSASD